MDTLVINEYTHALFVDTLHGERRMFAMEHGRYPSGAEALPCLTYALFHAFDVSTPKALTIAQELIDSGHTRQVLAHDIGRAAEAQGIICAG